MNEPARAFDAEKPPNSPMLHLTPEEHWARYANTRDFISESFQDEGFIHCTHGDDLVLEVGNRYYRDDARAYVLLEIEPARLSAIVRYEDGAEHYPHVYGPIDQPAIVRVRKVERHADGTFLALGQTIAQGKDEVDDGGRVPSFVEHGN